MPLRRGPPAPVLMLGATFLFALMALCVKLASADYGAGEIVLARSLVGLVLMGALLRIRGRSVATRVPAMHFWRGLSGTVALCLWFYAIGGLPLATAITLNYMSSVWIAVFLIGGAVLVGSGRVDGRLVATVLVGFVGVALVLRPTMQQQQAWFGLAGLASGVLSAMAYLQVRGLGRAGEPEERVVFYFSLSGVLAGAVVSMFTGGLHGTHSLRGLALLVAIGTLATAAQWLLTRAYAIGATLGNAALLYMGIVFGALFGVLLFDDPLNAMAVAGMVLIAGAGVAATWLSQRMAPPKRGTPSAPTEP
jgi:drug/metabolite transporter (DMT)-like permease